MPKPCVLISRCALGVPCRYHGQTHRMGHRIGHAQRVSTLRRKYRLIDICPEVDAGMSTPRPPTRICNGRWVCDGQDVTATFERGAAMALGLAILNGCQRAYLQHDSPACDPRTGCTAQLLAEHGVKILRL